VRQAGLRTLLRFDRYRRARRLLPEIGVVTAALDHEALDHAMKLRAAVMAILHVAEEIVDRPRRRVGIELERDRSRRGIELDLRLRSLRRSGQHAEHEGGNEQQAR